MKSVQTRIMKRCLEKFPKLNSSINRDCGSSRDGSVRYLPVSCSFASSKLLPNKRSPPEIYKELLPSYLCARRTERVIGTERRKRKWWLIGDEGIQRSLAVLIRVRGLLGIRKLALYQTSFSPSFLFLNIITMREAGMV